MYAVIRRTGLAGSPEEAAQRTQDDLVPLLRGQPGFRGYCGFVTEQRDAAFSFSIFDNRETAMDAHEQVRRWIRANMRDLMPEEPEIVAGETVFDSIAHPRDQGKDRQQALFVVIRTYHGLPGQTETMHSLVSEHTLPAIINAPGFHGFYAFRDEADPDRAISVTLFDSRDNALHSHQDLLRIMRERLGEMAYGAPEVTTGETVMLAAA